MSKSRVLILHSFKDKGYETRLQQIVNNPDLDGISFQHCCVIDHSRPSARITELDRLADEGEDTKDILMEVVKEEVKRLLDEQIAKFKPEVVIIHGGTVFDAVPDACITMISDLMEKHHSVQFALEGKSEWLGRRSGKNYSPFERKWAINQMRWVKQNFIDDKEVEEIIRSVF